MKQLNQKTVLKVAIAISAFVNVGIANACYDDLCRAQARQIELQNRILEQTIAKENWLVQQRAICWLTPSTAHQCIASLEGRAPQGRSCSIVRDAFGNATRLDCN